MSVVSTNNEAERPQSLARTRLGVTLAIVDGSQSRSFLNSPRQRQAEFVLPPSLVPVIWEVVWLGKFQVFQSLSFETAKPFPYRQFSS